MKELVEQLNAAHQARVADFGVPDRVILDTDVKIWNFEGRVMDNVASFEQVSWPALVPVFAGERQIGVATLYPKNVIVNGDRRAHIMATVSATADCPERLDHELGKAFSLDFQSTTECGAGASFKYEIERLLLEPNNMDPISTLESL